MGNKVTVRPPAAVLQIVREAMAAEAHKVGLDPERLEVTSLLNWGGFVNRSFRVTDGGVARHVKLSTDGETRRGLEQWWHVRAHLEAQYRAPPMIGWIDVAALGWAGPVFEWLDGRAPELSRTLLRDAGQHVRKLHNDPVLSALLVQPESDRKTCRDVYLATYHERFTEDLRFIASDLPAFVGQQRFDWMVQQADLLERAVRAHAAFAEPALSPTHGDLWEQNFWMLPSGQWYLLDWDELSLGDSVIDWAMLLGPTRHDLRPGTRREWPFDFTLEPAAAERFPLYSRAALLDWVIDPLSDYVGAADEPEHGEAMRQENRPKHLNALRAYESVFGEA